MKQAMDEQGLTPARRRILGFMLSGVTDPRVIAHRAGCTRQNVYKHLARLVEDGWVDWYSLHHNRVGAYEPSAKAREGRQQLIVRPHTETREDA